MIDRGFLEYFGPLGITKFINFAKKFNSLFEGFLVDYVHIIFATIITFIILKI